jgi:hypothetical protein
MANCYPLGLDVADEPLSWTSAGFRVEEGGIVRLGELSIRLLGRKTNNGHGIVGWSFEGIDANVASIDGIPVSPSAGFSSHGAPHPNGAVSVDHIVLNSPNVDNSIRCLQDMGISPIRETSSVRKGVRQVMFRPRTTIIELVGSKHTADFPPHLWGLTLVTNDVDLTHDYLSKTTNPPWAAVQPGRRMTVVKHKEHDMSVPVAFMSPHVKGLEGNREDRERIFEQRARAQEAELKRREEEAEAP